MNFVSFEFVIIFFLALAARLLLGRNKTEKSYFVALLVLSLVFYGWHVPWYVGLLVFSALVDYFVGIKLGDLNARSPKRKNSYGSPYSAIWDFLGSLNTTILVSKYLGTLPE